MKIKTILSNIRNPKVCNNTVNIYFFKVNNKNTGKISEMFKIDKKDTRTTSMTSFWGFFC